MIRLELNKSASKLYGYDNFFVNFFAPGRIDILGNLNEINGGEVLSCTINLGTYLAIAENNFGYHRFFSKNFSQRDFVTVPLNYFVPVQIESWINYPVGILNEFSSRGIIFNKGYDFYYYSNMPIGAGLASSASIGLVTALGLNHFLETYYPLEDLVKMANVSENTFVNKYANVKDQFNIGFSRKNNLLKFNTSTLTYKYINFDDSNVKMLLIHGTKPLQVINTYASRVSESKHILKVLNIAKKTNIKNLCSLDYNKLEDYSNTLKLEKSIKRIKYILLENKLVSDAELYLYNKNYDLFGNLLYTSHKALKECYEYTVDELDTIVDFLYKNKNCLGAKMINSNNTGCVLALFNNNISTEYLEALKTELNTLYQRETECNLEFYDICTNDGVEKCTL
ncbi:MAG: galactokinase [Bacteroidales bacterium]|jgi:galactokinase